MIRQAYYTTSVDEESNLCLNTHPLLVNCSGIEYIYPPYRLAKTRHDFYLMYIIDGHMPVYIGGKKQMLYPGSYIVIEPETQYSHTMNESLFAYYWVHFTGKDVYKILEDLNITLNTVHKTEISDDIKSCFSKMFKEFLIKDDKFTTITTSILTEILAYLSRTVSPSSQPLNSIKYICNNYNKEISLKQLADMENLSVSRYRTVFKNHTGMSPLDFIITQRIDTACYYLKHSSMSIEEVAHAVGYPNQFYFSRLFKSRVGKSPKQYSKL